VIELWILFRYNKDTQNIPVSCKSHKQSKHKTTISTKFDYFALDLYGIFP